MKAYELIDTPDKWCQGGSSENRRGKMVPYHDPGAVSFCLVASVWRAYGINIDSSIKLTRIRKRLGVDSLAAWNDDHNRAQAEVYALLKELDI